MDNRSWKDEMLDNTQEVDQEKMQGDIAILRKLNMLIEVRAFENPDLIRLHVCDGPQGRLLPESA
jgi:hypothetical protein